MDKPKKTRIFRIIHIDNLKILLNRKGLHAPNHEPRDSQNYKPIHDVEIQKKRKAKEIKVGPKGCLHDYVPFYFGTHSPMLLKLISGQVKGYNEGQDPIMYLVSHIENFNKGDFVFSDGHGVKSVTKWFDDIKDLDKIDWKIVNQKKWNDTTEDNDRQRRKQAECLIYKFCSWSQIRGIVVINPLIESHVVNILESYPIDLRVPVRVIKGWFY